jgi:spore maturation protein CgeB
LRILCVFGRYAYGDPRRGESYEHANFVPALSRLGHDVQLFDSFDRSLYRDFAELNRALVSQVLNWKPDLLLSVLMHYEVWTETLCLIRERIGVPVLNWGTDDSWKYWQFSRHVARCVDLYATTSHDALGFAASEGLRNVVLTQWAASDDALAEPLPASACRYPVTFVGAAYGNRRRWIESLRMQGIEVHCFGHGWPGGPIDTATLRTITRNSIVSLNFGDSGLQWGGLRMYRTRQIKARVFEVPGAGGLLLTEAASHLEEYYAIGQEIDTFSSPSQLAQKIRRYLNDRGLRDAIACAGHVRTRREHTYTRRLAPLLLQAGARRERPIGLGLRHPPPLVAMAGFERCHAPNAGIRMLRAAVLLPFILLFGRSRGRRAARRLLFELSWRLAGSRTYSASGWPGRLFYRES